MEFFSPTLLNPKQLGPIALEGFWRSKLRWPLDQNFDHLAQHGWGHIELAQATPEPTQRQYHFAEATKVLDRDGLLEASESSTFDPEAWYTTWAAANFLPVFQQLDSAEGIQPETIEDLYIDLCDMLQRIEGLDLLPGVKRNLLAKTIVLTLGARHGNAGRLLYPASQREVIAEYAEASTFTTYKIENELKIPFRVVTLANKRKLQKSFVPLLYLNKLAATVLAGPGNSNKDFMTPLARSLVAEATHKASGKQKKRIDMVSGALDDELKRFHLETQEYAAATKVHLARSFGSLSLALHTPRTVSRLAAEQRALFRQRKSGPNQVELAERLKTDSPLPLAEALSPDTLRARLELDRTLDRRYSLLRRGWDAIELAIATKNVAKGSVNWLTTGAGFLADACRMDNMKRDDDYFVAQVSVAAAPAWQRRARRQPLEARDITNIHNNFIFLLEQLLGDAGSLLKSKNQYRGQLAELLILTLATRCASREYFLYPSSWRERRSVAALNHDSYCLWRAKKIPISIDYTTGGSASRPRYPVGQIRVKETIGYPMAAWLYKFSHDRDFLDLPSDTRADHAIELTARTLVQCHRYPQSLNELQHNLLHKATDALRSELDRLKNNAPNILSLQ